jgi:hypothetical protein
MPYKRPLWCQQAFGIKNKIARTQANQFFHIFQSPPGPRQALRCAACRPWSQRPERPAGSIMAEEDRIGRGYVSSPGIPWYCPRTCNRVRVSILKSPETNKCRGRLVGGGILPELVALCRLGQHTFRRPGQILCKKQTRLAATDDIQIPVAVHVGYHDL